MSCFDGPNTVLTNAVLYLDAANSKSYPGSGTTWTDISNTITTGTIGTLVSGPTFSSANSGSIEFTKGTAQRTTFPANSKFLFLGTSPYTIDVWVKINVYPDYLTYRMILYREANIGAGRDGYLFWIDGAANGTDVFFASERFVAGTQTLVGTTVAFSTIQNLWNNFVITYDSTALRMYRNGILINGPTSDTRSIANNTTTLLIGGAGGTNAIGGNIATARLYNIALSSDQIQQNFNALRGRYGI